MLHFPVSSTVLFCFLNRYKTSLLLTFSLFLCVFSGWAQPVITSFSPQSGKTGTQVTLTGTGFSTTTYDNSVYIGGVQAEVVSASATSVRVKIPAAAVSGKFNITSNGFSAASSQDFMVTFPSTINYEGPSLLNHRTSIATGINTYGVAAGDVNGDGFPDLLYSHYSNVGKISIYLNRGKAGDITDSTFSWAADVSTGIFPFEIKLADLNGNGKLDIVVANYSGNSVSVIQNNSSTLGLSFGTAQTFATGSLPFRIAIADINGDGKPEILTANNTGANFSVLKNTITGGGIDSKAFAKAVNYSNNSNCQGISVADIDGDGKNDVVTASSSANNISVFRNKISNGDIDNNSFDTRVNIATSGPTFSVTTADLDADGKAEIITLQRNSSPLTHDVLVFRNVATSGSISTSSFETAVKYTGGVAVNHIITSDVNGDGKTDILTATSQDYVQTYLNKHSSGSFTTASFNTPIQHKTSGSLFTLAIADFNADGKPDAATNAYANFKIDVLQNFSRELFTATDRSSDAFVELKWDLPMSCLNGAGGDAVYVEVMDLNTKKEIFHQKIDSFPQNEPFVSGAFTHRLDSNISKKYALNLYHIGPGTTLCPSLFADNGRTDDFRKPVLESVTDFPDKIELKWKNTSDLVTAYRIYRDTTVIAILDSTKNSFTDKFVFNDSLGPKNGSTYNYCIEIYSNRLKKAYPKVCAQRQMFAINFKASDNTFDNKVELSWNKLAEFGQMVKILRDGSFYAQLPSTSTSYTDKKPIYGKKHMYELVLMQDGANAVAVKDEGGVKANGTISGRVIYASGDYAVKGAQITAVFVHDKDTFTRQTTSDASGKYSFTELYYHSGGTYTLTAKFGTQNFEQNPILVKLDNDTSLRENVDFKNTSVRNKGTVNLSFSGLSATPNPTFDYLTLGWNYTSADTMYFKIYRDDKLIELLSAAPSQSIKPYTDKGGKPGQQHQYKIVAYVVKNNVVSEKELKTNATFPVLLPVNASSATATPVNNAGYVELNWTHTSRNFSGFKIYRNTELIATLDTNARKFTDLTGANNQQAEYEFKAFAKRNATEYESAATKLSAVSYPQLTGVTGFAVVADAAKREVRGSWNFSRPITYNYDGFMITRRLGTSRDTLAFIDKNFPREFTDKNAEPGIAYTYVVNTYKKNVFSISGNSTQTVTFPAVAKPINFTASDGTHDGFIWLNWDDTTQNHNGYIIIRGKDTVALSYGSRDYTFLLESPYTDAKQTFRIATVYRKDGKVFYSDFATDQGYSKLNNGTIKAPSNFTASTEFSRHVQLKWEFPAYILATFKIYRDGYEIATLTTDQRLYYDYNARLGQTHTYQVQAVYGGNSSQMVSARGAVKSNGILSGNVTAAKGGIGIKGAKITAVADLYFRQFVFETETDANGFYRIENIPETDEGQLSVSAKLQNHGFMEDTLKFWIGTNDKIFTANFTDTFQNYIIESDEVAQPQQIVATPNAQDKTVELRWNVNSANYSGFKVYRGFTELAVLAADAPKMFSDTSGFPGYTYNYRVQAFWDLPEGRRESEFVGTSANYPVVLPVQDLQASADGARDILNLYWSHPADNHSYYEISRNNEVIGQLNIGNDMKFSDTSALPDHTYTYSVTAVQKINNRTFASEAVSVNGTFPTVSQVTDLTATDGNNALNLNWKHISTNHSGYKIYRDKKFVTLVVPTARLFSDTTGEPGRTYLYEVSPYRKIGEVFYESKAASIKALTPALRPPFNLNATASGTGTVNLVWSHTAVIAIDGFIILRNNIVIDTLKGLKPYSGTSYLYEDEEGFPQANYTYSVKSYSIRNGVYYYSPDVTDANGVTKLASIQYPQVPAPTSISYNNSCSPANITQLKWNYTGSNNSGFMVMRSKLNTAYSGGSRNGEAYYSYYDTDTIKVAGRRTKAYLTPTSYSYNTYSYFILAYIPGVGFSNNYKYDIYAYREINGNRYYSTPLTIISGCSRNSGYNVAATDGVYSNKVVISWDLPSGTISKFNVYRNDTLLASPNGNQTFVNDNDAVPGRKYYYHVKYVDGNNTEYMMGTDIGNKKENGILKGSVLTQVGNSAVPGVKVKATATIDGEIFTYNTITNAAGEYAFNNIYYAEKATYTVSVSFSGHEFVKSSQTADLTANSTTVNVQPFFDKTAYIITGIVRRLNVDCGLDSVKVTMKTYKKGTSFTSEKDVYTDKSGRYTFVYDPLDPDLLSIRIQPQPIKIIGNDVNADTLNFAYDLDYKDYNSFSNVPFVSTQNFTENTQYAVNLVVRNTCGPLDGNNKFYINIVSVDGCYNQTVQTDNSGKLSLQLPPFSYVMRVMDVEPATASNLPVLRYLSPRPQKFNLLALEQQLGSQALKNKTDVKVEFIYHKTPSISLVAGLNNYLCNDPAKPAIIQQNAKVSISLSVEELHNGTSCPVNEGFIIVNNNAAQTRSDTIFYDEQDKKFPMYEFIAGEPNIISPHVHYVVFEYHTSSGGFQGDLIKAILVEGVKAAPGNDIIVENEKNEAQVQMPLFVLRDPPGDGSQSYIEKGTKFTRTLTVTDQNKGFAGVKIESKTLFGGAGFAIDFSNKAGGGSGDGATYEVSGETTQRIETSPTSDVHNKNSTNWLTGEQADVIVGAGLAMQYGIAQEIKVSGCNVVNEFVITTSPSKIKTTWVYTVDQVTGLRDEYIQRIAQIDAGTLRIEGKTPDEAKAYYRSLQNNWNQILEYHRKQTVPYYNLCDVANYAKLPEPFKSQITEWVKNGFCNGIGTYSQQNGKIVFTLKNNVLWDTDLLDKYNKINQVVRNLSNSDYQLKFPGGLTFSGSTLNSLQVDKEYRSQYGADAENITFSGGSSISKQVSVSKSAARSYQQNWFFESDNFIGLAVDGEVKTSTGFALGSFFSITIPAFKFEDKYGVTFGYTHEFEREASSQVDTSATVGYVLSDDDPGDQFSVTVIRGIDPTHSPYFALLGGRSSCPSEPGAIQRDVPILSFEYPDGTGFNPNLYDQDPDKPVQIPIKMSNANPFNESRWVQIYVVENTNQYNADLSLGGTKLGTIDYFVPAGGSVYAYLTVKRNDLYYQHKDLAIALRPPCDQFYNLSQVNFSVEFRSPCSNISILTDNNWIINKADSGKQEALVVELADYNLKNEKLEEIKVQYRRRGSNKWINAVTLSRDSLISYYKAFQTSPNQLPTYFYVWDITGKPEILDGEYDIRAVAVCGIYGDILSDVITGTVDRSQIKLFGQPQPSDGLLSLGEDISVTFNKLIDCAALNGAKLTLRRKSDSSIISLNYSCFGNTVVWDKDPALMLSLEGETVVAFVEGVKDLSGNTLRNPIIWEFDISNNPVYWSPGTISLNIYKGSKDTVKAQLLNTGIGNQAYFLSGNDPAWLKMNGLTGSVPPNGSTVSFYVDATNLNLGMYRDTIVASITGFTDLKLPVEVNVYPLAPKWTVNPAQYTHSINVLANFSINNGSVSTDTLDKVAVSIGNQLRGIGNIMKFGNSNNYLAYLTVYGNASDIGKALDFRIWDASAGIEYDAFLANNDTIKFTTGNQIYGSIVSPRLLKVNTTTDSVRYIPLNQGWTWLSLNTELASMNVNNLLKSLTPTGGDLVKTLSTVTEYVNGKGWISLNGLNQFSTDSGYLVKLAKADTLRISGKNAKINILNLPAGWNLIGYPHQKAQPLNSVVKLSPAASNGDILKNDLQTAQYDKGNNNWAGTLLQMQPNKAYLLKLGVASELDLLKTDAFDTSGWYVKRNLYEQNMTITARIEINGNRLTGTEDRVAAFVGTECRGVGKLQYVPELGTYRLSMFIYSNTPGEKITFKILDSQGETIYDEVHEWNFTADSVVGTLTSPFVFSNVWTTGVKLTQTENFQLKVYPNPFSQIVTVSFEDDRNNKYRILLYDALGREVYRQSYNSTSGKNAVQLNMDGLNLQDGLYFLKVEGKKTTSTTKLFKYSQP